ncbi:MAG: hypothetical protein HYR96_05620 [Deltaproteobacteria bacterium]|nr:hypothetical protein [Deltaproteobacteria bacterium]
MRSGITSIPSEKQLAKVYTKLLHPGTQSPSPNELITYANWTRFDPRLAEIWVASVSRGWPEIHPMEINRAALASPWPATLGVLLEFTRSLVETDSQLRDSFRHWRALAVQGIPPAKSELYFLGLRALGSDASREDAALSTTEYDHWGYLGRENLLAKKGTSRLSKDKRKTILAQFARDRKRVKTSDYWNAVGRCITRRQAEREIKESGYFRPHGNTSSRY